MKKILCIILVCMMCVGLVGCDGSKTDKVYEINVSETTKVRNIKTATVTLVDSIDESPIDDMEYVDTFLNDVWEDLKIKHEVGATVLIKEKSGNDCGSVQFNKSESSIDYIILPKGGSMKTGSMK